MSAAIVGVWIILILMGGQPITSSKTFSTFKECMTAIQEQTKDIKEDELRKDKMDGMACLRTKNSGQEVEE